MKTLFTFCFLAVSCGMALAGTVTKSELTKKTGIWLVEYNLDKPAHFHTVQTNWADATRQYKGRYYYQDDNHMTNHYFWNWSGGSHTVAETYHQEGGERDEFGNWVDNPIFDIPLVDWTTNVTEPFILPWPRPYTENYVVSDFQNYLPHEYYGSDGYFHDDYTTFYQVYNTHSRYRMFNGGRGVVGSQVLHEVFGTAWHNNNKPWQYTDLHRVPPPGIHVCGDTLKVDPTFSENAAPGTDFGTLFVVGDAGSESDATPSIDDSCVYQIADMAYPLHVMVGTRDLTMESNVEFCVGQTLSFGTSWNTLPPNIVDVRWVHWHLPGKFVNDFFYPCSTCSMNYVINPDLLTNWTTTAWYIRDFKKANCSIQVGLGMSNGQYVNVAAAGQFSIYRPTVSFPYRSIGPMVPMITNGWLQLGNASAKGGDDYGTMQFDAAVHSKIPFNGILNWTQLIRRSLPGNPTDTGGNFNVDSSPYNSQDEPVSARGSNPPWGVVPFYDSPGVASWPGFWTLKDDFKTYLQFKPDDGIWVTLGIVTWGWSGKESSWTLTSSSTTAPTYQDSDEFPQWSR